MEDKADGTGLSVLDRAAFFEHLSKPKEGSQPTEVELCEQQPDVYGTNSDLLSPRSRAAQRDKGMDIPKSSAGDLSAQERTATYLSPFSSAGQSSTSPMSTLYGVLQEKVQELSRVSECLRKKEDECEHLRSIIKELSEARAVVARTKADLQDRFCALQAEFHKTLKVAEIARASSSQSLNRSSTAKRELSNVQQELTRSRRHEATLKEKNRRLSEENSQLRERLAMLERLQLLDRSCHQSVVMREFAFSRQVGLY